MYKFGVKWQEWQLDQVFVQGFSVKSEVPFMPLDPKFVCLLRLGVMES